MQDKFKDCIAQAQEIVSNIEDSQTRIESYRIVLSKLIDMKFGSRIGDDSISPRPSLGTDTDVSADNEMPVISPGDGTANNIRALFDTKWANIRRTTSEIRAALDANGVPDDKHVTTALNRLVESKELLRIKRDKDFVYWKNPSFDGGKQ